MRLGGRGRSRAAGALGMLAALTLACVLYARGAFLPSWTTWSEEATGKAHIPDAGANVRLVLESRSARLEQEGETGERRVLYRTPADWKVFAAACHDLDGDGSDELLLALWKRGTLGTSRALWEDDPWQRWHPWFAQHLYVLTYRDGAFVPFWMGGDLDARVATMYVGEDALVHLVSDEGVDTAWQWEGWGFREP